MTTNPTPAQMLADLAAAYPWTAKWSRIMAGPHAESIIDDFLALAASQHHKLQLAREALNEQHQGNEDVCSLITTDQHRRAHKELHILRNNIEKALAQFDAKPER